jgi:hypothetical protein
MPALLPDKGKPAEAGPVGALVHQLDTALTTLGEIIVKGEPPTVMR